MDERLQRLRRTVVEDPGAIKSLLHERVRRGELSPLLCEHTQHEQDPSYPGLYTSVTCGFHPPCCGGMNRKPFLHAVELAAFCGHDPSRELLKELGNEEAYVLQGDDEPWDQKTSSDCPECGWFLCHQYDCKKITFANWVKNLQRWGTYTLLVAAIAAARRTIRALRDWWKDDTRKVHYRSSIAQQEQVVDAAQAWVDCPCEKHLDIWRRLCGLDKSGLRVADPPSLFVPQPLDEGQLITAINCAVSTTVDTANTRHFTNAHLYAVISEALIEWALA